MAADSSMKIDIYGGESNHDVTTKIDDSYGGSKYPSFPVFSLVLTSIFLFLMWIMIIFDVDYEYFCSQLFISIFDLQVVHPAHASDLYWTYGLLF